MYLFAISLRIGLRINPMKWLVFFLLTVLATFLYVRYGKNLPENLKTNADSEKKPVFQQTLGGGELPEGPQGAAQPVVPKLSDPNAQPKINPANPSENGQFVPPPNNNFDRYQEPPPDQGYFEPPPPPPQIEQPDDFIVPQVNPPDMEVPPPPPIYPENDLVPIPGPDNSNPYEPPPPDVNGGDNNNQFYSPPPSPPVDQESF